MDKQGDRAAQDQDRNAGNADQRKGYLTGEHRRNEEYQNDQGHDQFIRHM